MRRTILLNQGWRFHLGEAEGAFSPRYDDRAWRRVTIPHDWAVEQPFDKSCSSGTGYLPGGAGWYRLRFTLPESVRDGCSRLTFGGVYQNSRVWLNGYYLGMRPYGYISFTYDVSECVKPGENTLCVYAEHAQLADSRWYTGNGIFRDVSITLTERSHIADVFAYTESVREGVANITVEARVTGGAVSFALIDAQGDAVACECINSENGVARASLILEAPHLWSPDDPYLYTLVCALEYNERVTDITRAPLGVRTIRFCPNEGFFLNDKHTKLKGVCVHHDAGALGAAVPREVWAARLQKFKAAGCNAIRTSHNPPDPLLLDLCDEMGFMVIDEAFDEWEGCKNKWWQGHNVYPPKHFGYSQDFPAWHERDLRDMVLRDRNHPCVILWSIGNEVDYPNDPYVHPAFETIQGNNDHNKPKAELIYDDAKPDARKLVGIAKRLKAIVRELDATRPVTIALACPEISNITGLSDVADVDGYNYKEALYEADHARYPNRVILGTENGMHAQAWFAARDNPFIAGQFLWTGIDFLGEARGWPVRVSTAGLLNTAGHEKPLYYHRKALWTSALCAKLAASASGRVWDDQFKWDFAPGQDVVLSCATNAQWAEAFINGRSLGLVELEGEPRAVWPLAYEPGEVCVKCGRGDELVEDSLRTPGEPEELCLHCDNPYIHLNGRSVAIIDIALVDARGDIVCGRDSDVCVQLLGDAQLLGIENGDPADLTSYSSATRSTYQGRAVCYVRSGTLPGEITVCAWTRNGLSATLTLETIAPFE